MATSAATHAVCALLAAVTLACTSEPDDGGLASSDPETPTEQELLKAWAREVALDTEFGGADGVIKRWVFDLRVSMVEGTSEDRALLEEAVTHLVPLIGPLDIAIAADGDDSADVQVYFIPLSSFEAVAVDNGFEYVPNNVALTAAS